MSKSITNLDVLIEKAKEEGELVWYSSSLDWASRRMLYEFEELYPFMKGKTKLEKGGSFKLRDKYNEELEADDVKVDVIHLSDPTIFIDWKKEGHLYYYPSKEYIAYPKEYKDDGYWAALRVTSVCIAYNAQVISKEEAPRTWKDLLDPKWKGKIQLGDPRQKGTRYIQYYHLREKYGIDFWKGLAKQDCRIEEKAGDLSSELLSGEYPIAGTYLGYFAYGRSIKKGEPIRAVWPSGEVPVVLGPVAIVAEAPHPAAASLFMDFILSLEGQVLFQTLLGTYSVRNDVPPLPGKIPFSELKPFPTDWNDYQLKQETYNREFTEISGLAD